MKKLLKLMETIIDFLAVWPDKPGAKKGSGFFFEEEGKKK